MGGRGGSSHRATAGGGGFGSVQTFLQNAYGAAHASAILALLQRAPSYIQSMWQDFAASFRADPHARRNDDEEAYYSPGNDWVHLGINAQSRAGSISTPYSVVFHEYGHMTDYLIARQKGMGRYSAYSDLYQGKDSSGKLIFRQGSDGLLGRTAKLELESRLQKIQSEHRGYDRSMSTQSLLSEARSKYSMRDRSDISDMMEGAGIGIAYPLGSGHGLDYWSSRGSSKEIFAEITSAEAAHPGSLKAIKEYFPQTYSVYMDMVKERKKR